MSHNKSYSIQAIADLVKGTLTHAHAQKEPLIKGVADIRTSKPHHLSFCAKATYESYIYTTSATAVLVHKSFKATREVPTALIYVDQVYDALRIFLEDLDQPPYPQKTGTEEPNHLGQNTKIGTDVYRGAFSYIGDNVDIGDRVQIYPHVYIGDNVRIGSDSTIYAGAYIHSGVEIGQRCVIQSAAVLGSNGFGYVRAEDGSYKYIPQIGKLILEDDVHIGSSSILDRGTFGNTVVETGVRLDSQVGIAHNSKVGAHTIMCGHVGVAGSVTIGPYCVMGGQVGIADNLQIAAHTSVAAQSGVTKNVTKEHTKLIGTPAMDRRSLVSRIFALSQIPHLEKRLKKVEDIIKSFNA